VKDTLTGDNRRRLRRTVSIAVGLVVLAIVAFYVWQYFIVPQPRLVRRIPSSRCTISFGQDGFFTVVKDTRKPFLCLVITRYSWQGDMQNQFVLSDNSPTPYWAPFAGSDISPNCRYAAVALRSGDALCIRSWRDGKALPSLALPTTGLGAVLLQALDDGRIVVRSEGTGISPAILRDGRLLAGQQADVTAICKEDSPIFLSDKGGRYAIRRASDGIRWSIPLTSDPEHSYLVDSNDESIAVWRDDDLPFGRLLYLVPHNRVSDWLESRYSLKIYDYPGRLKARLRVPRQMKIVPNDIYISPTGKHLVIDAYCVDKKRHELLLFTW